MIPRFFAFTIFFLAFPVYVLAQADADDILEHAQKNLQPQSVQEQQEENTSFIKRVCDIITFPLVCEGKKTHDVFAPSVKTPGEARQADNETLEEINALNEEISALSDLSDQVAGASSDGEVLQASSFIDSIRNFFSPEGLFIEEETAVTTRHLWPASVDLGDDPEEAVSQKVARGMLMPASVQKDLAQAPDQEPGETSNSDESDDQSQPPDAVSTPTSAVSEPTPADSTDDSQADIRFNAASRLAASAQSVCRYGGTPGRVTRYNVSCLDNITPPLTAQARIEMRNSANAYTNLQCVGLVRGMAWQMDNQALEGGGNAIDFATNVPTGFRFVRRGQGVPSPRDLLIWNIGAFGHIAYVTHRYDANTVEVIEANWGSSGKVQTRTVYLGETGVYGFVTPI